MNAPEFEEVALALVAQGYSPLVISPRSTNPTVLISYRPVPGGKAPGIRVGGEWAVGARLGSMVLQTGL